MRLKEILSFNQDELYQWAYKINPRAKSVSGFATISDPYIVTTDFPFLIWPRFSFRGKTMITIAGSGDNIISLWPTGIKAIIGVDIAIKACFINELKRAALKLLSFSEFRELFAPSTKNPFFPVSFPEKKREIYFKIRHYLSNNARNWLDKQFGHTHFPSPRRLEVFFAHLIPHFAKIEAFKEAKRGLKDYPLINLPIEVALEVLSEEVDIIYLSNISEYIKQTLILEDKDALILPKLEDLFKKAAQRLKPGGWLMVYCFGNIRKNPQMIKEEMTIFKRLGLKKHTETFSFNTSLISGSHFTHSLLLGIK